MRIQEQLGADIQMVLDVCPALPAPTRWCATRSTAPPAGPSGPGPRSSAAPAARTDRGLAQAQFGIVQGGIDAGLRVDSARRTVAVGFDGYAIGGLSVGESRDEMLPTPSPPPSPSCPADQPRYLMGVGDPVSLVEAIALGVDMFDCVLPTRLGPPRHGPHRRRAPEPAQRPVRHATTGPLDPACPCPSAPAGRGATCATCSRWAS